MIDTITTAISISAICAALYAIKGGQLKKITFKSDGKISSTILFGILCYFLGFNPLLGALGWIVAVSPSVGEEIGATGGYKGGWGPYLDYPKFGRVYGVKKALQRGVWMGAALTVCLQIANPVMLFAGASFPLAHWLGISYVQHRLNQPVVSWYIAEWVYGAFIGLGLSIVFLGA